MLIACTANKYDAVMIWMKRHKIGLEFDPFPWPAITFLPDTDIHLPLHQRSGWAMTGSWGAIDYHGTRWPDRWMIEEKSEALHDPKSSG